MTSSIIISPSISESSDAWAGKCPRSKTSEHKSGRQVEVLDSQVDSSRIMGQSTNQILVDSQAKSLCPSGSKFEPLPESVPDNFEICGPI